MARFGFADHYLGKVLYQHTTVNEFGCLRPRSILMHFTVHTSDASVHLLSL